MNTVVNIEAPNGYWLIPSINGIRVEMGEDGAELEKHCCTIHGLQYHIGGSNQGGQDGMSVCLKCCVLIYEELAPPLED